MKASPPPNAPITPMPPAKCKPSSTTSPRKPERPTMTTDLNTLYVIPVASTSFFREAYWDGRTHSIRFGYEESGKGLLGGIEFGGFMAIRHRAEICCTVSHIQDCYDTLIA